MEYNFPDNEDECRVRLKGLISQISILKNEIEDERCEVTNKGFSWAARTQKNIRRLQETINHLRRHTNRMTNARTNGRAIKRKATKKANKANAVILKQEADIRRKEKLAKHDAYEDTKRKLNEALDQLSIARQMIVMMQNEGE